MLPHTRTSRRRKTLDGPTAGSDRWWADQWATAIADQRLRGRVQADQDRYAPHSICFGCGPANAKGLQIKSHWEGDPAKVGEGGGRFVMEYTPQPHHQAFPGVVNGGILGTLLDCHSNWCAATGLMHRWGWGAPQCTVTADFHVRLKRPTPAGKPLRLEARIEQISEDRATIHCDVHCDGKVTATCDGTFVAVKEGHPAWHRWG